MATENKSSSNIIGYVIIALVLLTLGGAGILLYSEYFKKPDTMPAPGASDAEAPNNSAAKTPVATAIEKVKQAVKVITSPSPSAFPLQTGSRGNEVENVQHYLNSRYNSGLVEDGIFGSLTKAALITSEKTSSVSQAEYNNLMSWMAFQTQIGNKQNTAVNPNDLA